MLKLNNSTEAPRILSRIVENNTKMALMCSSDYCWFLTTIVGDNRKIGVKDSENRKFGVKEIYINERNLSEIKVVLENGKEWELIINDVDNYRELATNQKYAVKTDCGAYIFEFSPQD